MYYMYVLFGVKDHKLYFGFTSDLKKRFKEHNSGSVQSTKTRIPFALLYYEAFLSKKDALLREHQMKHFGKSWCQLKKRLQNSVNDVLKVRG